MEGRIHGRSRRIRILLFVCFLRRLAATACRRCETCHAVCAVPQTSDCSANGRAVGFLFAPSGKQRMKTGGLRGVLPRSQANLSASIRTTPSLVRQPELIPKRNSFDGDAEGPYPCCLVVWRFLGVPAWPPGNSNPQIKCT